MKRAAARSRDFTVLNPDARVELTEYPFRQLVVDNVFTPAFYETLCREFAANLGRGLFEEEKPAGLGEEEARHRFRRFGHYDAYYRTLNPRESAPPSSYFFSTDWRDYLNSFFQLPLNHHTMAEYHHHRTGSGDGYVHNDYEVASFVDNPLPNGINGWFHQCAYRGRATNEQGVRSLAILFYLNNPDWREGDGGETALYIYYDGHPIAVRQVAPVNNRLLAFEVSPQSFHGFCTNRKAERNCLAQWYHTSEKEMIARYGEPPEDGLAIKRNVLVTGATGTLGRALIERLGQSARVVGVARHPRPEANGFTLIQGDIATEPERIAEQALGKLGKIDLVINAAVQYQFKALTEFTPEEIRSQFETNVLAPLLLSREILKRYWGSRREDNLRLNRNIINISSISSIAVYGGGQSIYAATKSALNALTAHMATEFIAMGIRVNAIAPTSFPHLIATEAVVDAILALDRSSENGVVKVMGKV